MALAAVANGQKSMTACTLGFSLSRTQVMSTIFREGSLLVAMLSDLVLGVPKTRELPSCLLPLFDFVSFSPQECLLSILMSVQMSCSKGGILCPYFTPQMTQSLFRRASVARALDFCCSHFCRSYRTPKIPLTSLDH